MAPSLLDRTVALIPPDAQPAEHWSNPSTLGELIPELCSDQPWLDQPTLAACTGFMLGGSWVLTARHCVVGALSCSDYEVVRGYQLDAEGSLEPLASQQIFRCQRVIYDDARLDVAIIELDRAVSEEPAPVLSAPQWEAGMPVILAHHPLGTPLKVDEEASLFSVEPARALADAFSGSSGAPVVDLEGHLLGVLSGGARDFETDPSGCIRARELTYPDEAGGEHIVPAEVALCDACAEQADSPVCDALPRSACHPTASRHELLAANGGCSTTPRSSGGGLAPIGALLAGWALVRLFRPGRPLRNGA